MDAQNEASAVEQTMNLLQIDDQFQKTQKENGLIEGTHFVTQDESELKYDINTIMGLVISIMEQNGTLMSDTEVIQRINQEKAEYENNNQLIMVDKKLEQLVNLHQYHDTFLKESKEALRLEIFTIEERLLQAAGMTASGDKKIVDKKGAELNPNE